MGKLKQRGFTIIEVLIVIAVFGVIISVVFASAKSLQRSSRDNDRKDVAAKIAAALPEYAANNSGKYTGFSCSHTCGALNDPDTDSDEPLAAIVGAAATATSGVIYVLGGTCGHGGSSGTAIAGTRTSYAVLYWQESDMQSHCLGGGTAATADPTPAPAPLPDPAPADTPTNNANTRDLDKIAELQRIHASLVDYNAKNGYLPYTADYGEYNITGWDYSSQGAFVPFLTPAANPPAPNNGHGDIFYCSTTAQESTDTYDGSPCGGYGLGYFCYTPNQGWAGNYTSLGARLEDPASFASNPHMGANGVYYELNQQNIGHCGQPPAATANGSSQTGGCITGVTGSPYYCRSSGTTYYSCDNYKIGYNTTNVLAGNNWLTLNYDDHNCQDPDGTGPNLTRPPSNLYKFNVNIYVNNVLVSQNQQLDPAGGRAVINLGATPANPRISIEWTNNYWVTDDPQNNPYKYDPDFQINSIGVGR